MLSSGACKSLLALTFKRSFSHTLKGLYPRSAALTKAYAKIFEQQPLNSLINRLSQKPSNLDPYELSESLVDIISKENLPVEDVLCIHNKLIENLSEFEYGISTIHAKKLQELGESPRHNSVIEIIKNNPGRVSGSWELLLKYGNGLPEFTDELLNVTLESIINSTDFVDDSENPPLREIAQCILLLKNVADKEVVNPGTLQKLLEKALKYDITCLLPLILSFGLPHLGVIEDRGTDLTAKQLFYLNEHSFQLIKQSKVLLYRTIEALGENTVIKETEKELETSEKLKVEVDKLSAQTPGWSSYKINTDLQTTAPQFLKLFEQLQADKIDRSDFNVAKMLLRAFGLHKNNTKISLELYHKYLTSYPGFSHELMFETFLALSYQSYRTSNKALLGYAEAFISSGANTTIILNTFRTLILVNSKFNIDESLEIYNKHINDFSQENDAVTHVSQQGLIAETLILAYLSKGEIEFARVIFEGCLRGEVFKSPTAIKRVKNLMTLYGDALENEEVSTVMEGKILNVLQHL